MRDTFTEEHERRLKMDVASIRRDYEKQLEAIRADKTLSFWGKRSKIKALYEETERQIAKLRAEHEAELQRERRELQRRAFGAYHPHTATEAEIRQIDESYRHALDRAEQAENPTEALALLRRADLAGDEVLARAVGLVAAERGWNNVLDAVTAQGAVYADAVQELRQHMEHDSPQAKFQRRMAFTAPSRPPELDRPVPPEAAL